METIERFGILSFYDTDLNHAKAIPEGQPLSSHGV